MFTRIREYFPAILNLLAASIIMIISFSNYFKFSIAPVNAKLVGIIIVYVGMGIFVWASFYLKYAIVGMIQPRLDKLVKNGPYKYCRHPVYFGIAISFWGLAFALKSWLGLLAVLLIFLPCEIYRAKIEEKLLLEKFGDEWMVYKKNTGFFIPFNSHSPPDVTVSW